MRSSDPRVETLSWFFDRLSSANDLAALPEIYAEGARFKDPFNEVRGREAIHRIYAHMFEQVDAPRFVVLESVCEGDMAFLVWDFSFRRRGTQNPISVIGSTQLRFDTHGRIAYHRDFWDPAEGIYEKLPWIGGVFRFLRRKAGGA